MSKEESLQELDRRLERIEKATSRLEFLLPTAEKLALHLNAQTDDAKD